MSSELTVVAKPRVAVVVVVTSCAHPNCVLLGKRKNAFGAGCYALTGGFLECGESFESGGCREVKEETGLTLTNVCTDCLLNVVWEKEKEHYVTILLRGEVDTLYQLEPVTLEPNKCEGWEWHDWNNLPDEIFKPLVHLKQSGYNPFRTTHVQHSEEQNVRVIEMIL